MVALEQEHHSRFWQIFKGREEKPVAPVLILEAPHFSEFQQAWRELEHTYRTSREGMLKDFDMVFQFLNFVRAVEELGYEHALQKREERLLFDMISSTQEATGKRNQLQIPTHVFSREVLTKEGVVPQLIFRNTHFEDVKKGDEKIAVDTPDGEVKERYKSENKLFYMTWDRLLESIEHLIPEKNVQKVIKELEAKKWRYEPHFPVSQNMCALWHELGQDKTAEAYVLPQKILTVSPTFHHYADGKSSIARVSQVAFFPKIGVFGIVEDAINTGYQDSELTVMLGLDAEQKPLPQTKEEFFAFLAILGEVLQEAAPHAIFEYAINRVGYWVGPPVGENVVVNKERDYQTQMKLARAIIDLELKACLEDPQKLAMLPKRLMGINKAIIHSLLRANKLHNWKKIAQDYQNVFWDKEVEEVRTHAGTEVAATLFKNLLIQRYADYGITKVTGYGACYGMSAIGEAQKLMQNPEFLSLNMNIEELLKRKRSEGFKNTKELDEFCKKFGLDRKLFKKNTEGKKCLMCGEATDYIGPCACPSCDAEYKLANAGHNFETVSPVKPSKVVEFPTPQPQRSIGLSELVSSFASREVLAA